MNILMTGGTRFMGIHCIEALLNHGDHVTIATRGKTPDQFGSQIERIIMDRYDEKSIRGALAGKHFDCVIDTLAYSSNEARVLLNHLPSARYVMISSTAVYDLHEDTIEAEFNPLQEKPSWGWRKDFSYAEGKRNAERALFQKYKEILGTAVRFPFVIGRDDYTERLRYYVSHIMHDQPINVDHSDAQMSFVRSDEAGQFLAYLAHHSVQGAFNGASAGTVSIQEIADYVLKKTGHEMILQDDRESAPYNGTPAYSINTEKAERCGYMFSELNSWMFNLLDWHISQENI